MFAVDSVLRDPAAVDNVEDIALAERVGLSS
jgi:hypothetical protein